jgi:hypothetical protein
VLRARDYKSKKNRLKNLREKVALRNGDEFYWGMVKGKTKVSRARTSERSEKRRRRYWEREQSEDTLFLSEASIISSRVRARNLFSSPPKGGRESVRAQRDGAAG